MQIEVRRAEYRDVEPMRGLYRAELNCQIIHDSFLARGQSDPYLILVDGRLAGYGAVSNKYGKGRLNEFYTAPRARGLALPMFRELLAVSEATHIETQTNFAHAVRLRDERNGRERAVSRRVHDGSYLCARRVPGGEGPVGDRVGWCDCGWRWHAVPLQSALRGYLPIWTWWRPSGARVSAVTSSRN